MAEDAKRLGDAAFAAKTWEQAATRYTEAIELGAGTADDDLMKKVHSNRSAVYASQNKWQQALADADKCIEIDSEWAKGFVRKGDALYGLRKWTEAHNAYSRADTLAPGTGGYAAKAQAATDARFAEEEAASRRYAQAGAQGGIGSVPPRIPSTGMSAAAYQAAEKMMFVFFFAYLLPLSWIPVVGSMLPSSTLLFRAVLCCALTINILHLVTSAGRPQLSKDYAAKCVAVQGVHCTFLATILLPSRPYLLAALPLLLGHVVVRTEALLGYVLPMVTQAKQMMANGGGGAMAKFLPSNYEQQFDQLSAAASTPQGQHQLKLALANVACTAEVMQGVYLAIELAMPSRNLMLLYLWWQYLLMRYLMDQTGAMLAAFRQTDARIAGLTSHSMCPAIVGKGYNMLRGWMVSQAQSYKAQAEGRTPTGAGGGGFMDTVKSKLSSCSIA